MSTLLHLSCPVSTQVTGDGDAGVCSAALGAFCLCTLKIMSLTDTPRGSHLGCWPHTCVCVSCSLGAFLVPLQRVSCPLCHPFPLEPCPLQLRA